MVLVAYLSCTVSKLGQDFGSVVWDDAHGVTGQVELLQTGQRGDVSDFLQLETKKTTNMSLHWFVSEEKKHAPRSGYLGQLVVAEVQVDQRVELGEACKLLQLVAGQAQGFDVPQTGVSSFQDPKTVIGQIHVHQVVQMLQPQNK